MERQIERQRARNGDTNRQTDGEKWRDIRETDGEKWRGR